MEDSERAVLVAQVQAALAQLRPFFEEDGGDVTFVEVTDDLIAKVKLHGACESCSMSVMTLRAGVEESIKKFAPQIQGVQAINMPDPATATSFGQ